MPVFPFALPESPDGLRLARALQRRIPLATTGVAVVMAVAVVGVSAVPGLGLTEVPAQPKSPGIVSPNYISPELIEYVVAQGSWVLENPSSDGVIKYYGYLYVRLAPDAGAHLMMLSAPASLEKASRDRWLEIFLAGISAR